MIDEMRISAEQNTEIDALDVQMGMFMDKLKDAMDKNDEKGRTYSTFFKMASGCKIES